MNNLRIILILEQLILNILNICVTKFKIDKRNLFNQQNIENWSTKSYMKESADVSKIR